MSFGLLVSENWGMRPIEKLLTEVDAALYGAKEAGRNCVRLATSDSLGENVSQALRETANPVR
jgi:hypothetical protein